VIGSFFCDPHQTAGRRHPFATIVNQDFSSGLDPSSKLDRPGVFRRNLS